MRFIAVESIDAKEIHHLFGDFKLKTPLLLRTAICRIFRRLVEWGHRMNEHEKFSHLTDSQLRDAGLTRTDLVIELNKPFWRV
jgi:uncharacterized protein YjiS (DUF1127 family)